MHPTVEHTLTLYEKIYTRMPPLVPELIVIAIEAELSKLRSQEELSLEEVEETIALHGKKLWPYMKAFEDMVNHHEANLGEKTLLQKASPRLRKKYALISKIGGGYAPVVRGQSVDHFDHDEKQELNELLVDLKRDVRTYAMQAVLTHDRATYEEKIEYYGAMIEEINETIGTLKALAEKHRDIDAALAEDIISKIRAIEQSFTFIGPEMDIEEIRKAPEYYEGRRMENKMRWGK